MDDKWNFGFNDIPVNYEDKWIRIKCDRCLKSYLAQNGNSAIAFADYLLEQYQKKFQKPLHIKRHSLAIEILAHAYADSLSKAILEKESQIPKVVCGKIKKVLMTVCQHTDIIDCGEKPEDTNRFLWDDLEPFHAVIYGILSSLS